MTFRGDLNVTKMAVQPSNSLVLVIILLVSISNHGSISHRLGAMDVESFCYNGQRTDGHALSDKGDAARVVALTRRTAPAVSKATPQV